MAQAELTVTVQGTPNPNAAKFTLNRSLPDQGGRSYFGVGETGDDALAARLFDVEGVRALFMVDNFITVTKVDEVRWDDLVEPIEAAIREVLEETGA
jgi:8-oxo-dGTP pyrophosphatase MutT (NUDIX family)